MKRPDYRPQVKLIDKNGNAFAILGSVTRALLSAGADKEYVDQYLNEAMSGDSNHLLAVSMEYVDVY